MRHGHRMFAAETVKINMRRSQKKTPCSIYRFVPRWNKTEFFSWRYRLDGDTSIGKAVLVERTWQNFVQDAMRQFTTEALFRVAVQDCQIIRPPFISRQRNTCTSSVFLVFLWIKFCNAKFFLEEPVKPWARTPTPDSSVSVEPHLWYYRFDRHVIQPSFSAFWRTGAEKLIRSSDR